MFDWDETDFIACLETVPSVEASEERGEAHTFTVSDSRLRLEIVVFPLEGDVHILLYRDGIDPPVVDLTLLDCAGARYIADDAGERLEFAAPKLTPTQGAVSVAIKPHIQVRLAG